MKKYRNNIKYIFQLLSLFIFALMLQACATKFVYTQLDWIIAQYIEQYVSLDNEQSELLKKQLDKSLRWHRKTQLSQYANWIKAFRDDVENGLDRAKVNNHFTSVNAYYKSSIARLIDDIGILLPGLTADQTKEVMDIFIDENDEFQEMYLNKNKEELKKQKLEKLTEQFENWLDDLTEQQKGILNSFVMSYEWHYAEHYRLRLEWQRQLSVLLKQAKIGKDVIENIKGLNYNNLRNEQSKKKLKQKKQRYMDLIVSISKTMSKKQKEYFFEKIDDYNALFLDLI